MRKLFTLCLLVFTLSASAQWQQTGSKVRYVNGLGIPTRDTAAGVAADSSQILIRPADSSLYVKYKRTWLRVGGGGGSIAGSGTTNYIPKFTSSTAIGNSQIFDNGTNVGVGETSPNGKLDVRSATGHVGINTGTSVSPERGNLYYTTDGTGWKLNIGKLQSGTFTPQMTFQDNGNVGIGTASPAYPLQVRRAGGAGSLGISIDAVGNTDRAVQYFSIQDNAAGVGAGHAFYYRTPSSTTDVLGYILDEAGNVGIGTASPANKLDVFTTNRTALNTLGSGVNVNYNGTTTGEYATIGFSWANSIGNNSTQWGMGMVGTNFGSGTAALNFFTNGSERMRITSAGDVGIGTASPSSKLDVDKGSQSAGGTTPSGALLISNRTAGNGILELGVSASAIGWLQSRNSTSATYYPLSLNPSAGNVLIGTATDNGTDRLQVSGSALVTSLFGVGITPANILHLRQTTPSVLIDDADNTGTASIHFRPVSASYSNRASLQLISTGSAAPTRFVIASTDTMTFRTNNIERMRVTSAGGNVLISKTTDNGIDKLQVNGSIDAKGFAQAYTTKTGAYTATTSDYLIDCLSGTFTVTLPDALLNVGRILVIKNSGTGTITVDGNGSQTIDGATTYSLSAQWATVQIMCDGGNWKILAKF